MAELSDRKQCRPNDASASAPTPATERCLTDADAQPVDKTAARRAQWASAQATYRLRMEAENKTLLRLWVTPAEAAKIRETVKKIRRAERLRLLQRHIARGRNVS